MIKWPPKRKVITKGVSDTSIFHCSDEKRSSERESPRTLVPSASGLFNFLLLVRFFGGGDFLSAVQERTQRHPAEHIAMSLLDELHQLADVAVQTLKEGSKSEEKEKHVSQCENNSEFGLIFCVCLHRLFL